MSKEAMQVRVEENDFNNFESRVWEETDFAQIIDGILPKDALFNPEYPIKKIETALGPVKVIKGSRRNRSLKHLFSRVAGIGKAKAEYSPTKREITITPELDNKRTLIAYANQDYELIVGDSLAHEALHAHQDILHKRINSLNAVMIIREAMQMIKVDDNLKLVEAIQLTGRSRDMAIVTEAQAYLLNYMLRGPSVPPSVVLQVVKSLKESNVTNWQNYQINGVTLDSFAENGQMSAIDYIVHSVRSYLPKIDQENEDYLLRISNFCQQLIEALYLGLSHFEIASLIRKNYEEISAGSNWDPENKVYRFLQKEIDALAQKQGMPHAWTLGLDNEFNKRVALRLSKLTKIAEESLSK